MEEAENRFSKILIVLSYFTLILLVLWIFFMIVNAPEGSMQEQLRILKNDMFLYILNFVIAAIIAFPLATILVILTLLKSRRHSKKLNITIYIFVISYWILVSTAYMSQVITLPLLLADTPNDDLLTLDYIYFHNNSSFPAVIDLLGYCCFGFAAILLGYKLFIIDKFLKWVSIFLVISGISSVIAFAGVIAGFDEAGIVSIFSGVMVFPICITLILWGKKNSLNTN